MRTFYKIPTKYDNCKSLVEQKKKKKMSETPRYLNKDASKMNMEIIRMKGRIFIKQNTCSEAVKINTESFNCFCEPDSA